MNALKCIYIVDMFNKKVIPISDITNTYDINNYITSDLQKKPIRKLFFYKFNDHKKYYGLRNTKRSYIIPTNKRDTFTFFWNNYGKQYNIDKLIELIKYRRTQNKDFASLPFDEHAIRNELYASNHQTHQLQGGFILGFTMNKISEWLESNTEMNRTFNIILTILVGSIDAILGLIIPVVLKILGTIPGLQAVFGIGIIADVVNLILVLLFFYPTGPTWGSFMVDVMLQFLDLLGAIISFVPAVGDVTGGPLGIIAIIVRYFIKFIGKIDNIGDLAKGAKALAKSSPELIKALNYTKKAGLEAADILKGAMKDPRVLEVVQKAAKESNIDTFMAKYGNVEGVTDIAKKFYKVTGDNKDHLFRALDELGNAPDLDTFSSILETYDPKHYGAIVKKAQGINKRVPTVVKELGKEAGNIAKEMIEDEVQTQLEILLQDQFDQLFQAPTEELEQRV